LALLGLLALWLATLGNLPLWLTVWQLPETHGAHAVLMFIGLGLLLLAFSLLALALLVWPRWFKPAGLLLLLISAASSYFMHAYGVVIDSTMIGNVAHTNVREARDLLSGDLLLALVLGVLLPGLWWWRQPLQAVPLRRLMPRQLGLAALALLVAAMLGWASFQDLASLMRNHRLLRYMVNPYNTLYALGRHALGRAAHAQQPLQPLGEDAVATTAATDPGRGPLLLLLVGETARAANFGLGGYARDTTPRLRELQQRGELVYFPQVHACGTKLDPVRRARGAVVVLHQMGSHGPAYARRTPAAHKPYQPECVSVALQDCSPEQLVNAYDNTVRYTDHVLAEAVGWLRAQAGPTALLYVSDHGESLGEKGLYLHGIPYSFAPQEQTHVPMALWLSPAMRTRLGLDIGCLQQAAAQPLAHDHLFHSVLHLAQVQTRVRRKEMDFMKACARIHVVKDARSISAGG
jgi:glucan phosphoethanolaminetransferase (alkaline phosphatase superfamily)